MSDTVAMPVPTSVELCEAEASPDVVITTVNRPSGDTGVHAHTRALSAGLVQAGIGCRVIGPYTDTSRWKPMFAVRPLVLKRLNPTWGTRWYRYWHQAALRERLLAKLQDQQPAAIIAQCPLSAAAALQVREKLHARFPIGMVCHFNYSEATEYREKGELADGSAFTAVLEMETRVLQDVDAVFYVSEWSRRVVEVERGIAPRSSAVIWNGIESNLNVPPLSRASLGLSSDDVVLVNVGSLEARKNQIGLLDLFARVASEYSSAKLILVGDGPQRREIESRIMELGLQARVICLGFRSDVPAIFSASDLYVHYAKLENCPVILLEAARASLPVASLPAGGAAEILRALGGGALLDEADLFASMKTLRPLLWEASARQAMGLQLRQGFESRFTQQAMVSQYLRQLGQIGAKLVPANVGVAA